MTKIIKYLVSLAVMLSASSTLACDYPSRPDDLPDGNSASKEEMVAGVALIKEYQEKMTAYLTCIEADEIVAEQAVGADDAEAQEQRKAMFNKKYNAAVDEQTLMVEEFNAQIRAYKAQSN